MTTPHDGPPAGYIVKCWFAGDRDKTRDVLGWLYRPGPEGTRWFFDYRFRYYRSNQAFESNDEKNFYRMSMEGTKPESEVVRALDEAFVMIARVDGLMPPEGALIQSADVLAVVEKLRGMSWFHFKLVPA